MNHSVSEGGREGRAGKRGVGRGTRYATLRVVQVSVARLE